MTDLSIVVWSLVTSLLSSGLLRSVSVDRIEREGHERELTGHELRVWIERRTGCGIEPKKRVLSSTAERIGSRCKSDDQCGCGDASGNGGPG